MRGKRILEVGESGEMRRKYESLDRIDASGRAVMPGFVNAHTHSVLTVLRGTVEDMGGDAIYGYMSPISFAMTDEDRRAMNALGCLEAIRSGTTTMVDPFRHVYQYAQTMADSGLRLFLSESCADALNLKIRYGIYEYSEEWGQQFLDRTERLIGEFHGMDGGRVQCQVAAHAPDNCSPWMLRKLLDMSEKHGLRRTVHLAQSQKELDQVRSISGKSSAAYLRDNGWLGPDVLAAHWFFCDEADVEILAETGTHMAHCPAPSARTGRYPAPKMPNITDSGVNVTLGTDNMSENMFQALNVGIVLNRGLRDDDPSHPDAPDDAGLGDSKRGKGRGYGAGIRVYRGWEVRRFDLRGLGSGAPGPGNQPGVEPGSLRRDGGRGIGDGWRGIRDEAGRSAEHGRGRGGGEGSGGDTQGVEAIQAGIRGHIRARLPGPRLPESITGRLDDLALYFKETTWRKDG